MWITKVKLAGKTALKNSFYIKFLEHIEILAVLLGFIYLFLIGQKKRLAWIFGIASSILYCYICSENNLKIQAGLQFIYVLLGALAYYQWGQKTEIAVRTISWKKHLLALIIGCFLSFALGIIFAKNGQFLPFLDAFIAVFAIFSTFLALKAILENWIYWIILNLLSMYLFWAQGLNFSVFLFFGYALTAVYGFYQWKKELKDGQTT